MKRQELFGRAMAVLKGLNLAVDWELAPSIKKEIADICAEFEADAEPTKPTHFITGMSVAKMTRKKASAQGDPYLAKFVDLQAQAELTTMAQSFLDRNSLPPKSKLGKVLTILIERIHYGAGFKPSAIPGTASQQPLKKR